MAKGDYSTKYSPDLLRSKIAEGKTAKQIMKEFGISRFTLKEHLLLLQERDKKYYEVPGLLEDQEAALRIVKRRRGTVCSPATLVLPNFRPTDAFEMHEDEDGRIVLVKLN
ncbi:MAG: AbrB/MazE/SpoVT family DNA-binding domain-containing protein [Desulfovermiculus sp.]|nr:AbrB/MazE/SpoVT family DNA-binding domain-containing protein [Desulfovermiculus sp.]